MWQQVEQALRQSTHQVLFKLASFLPALIALLLALVIMTAIGMGLAALLRRSLTAAKFEALTPCPSPERRGAIR